MAAGNTYQAISTTTLGSATGTVTFSSIPQTYTDLVLVRNVKYTSTNGEDTWVRFNSDTGSNYSRTVIAAYTSPPYSLNQINATRINIYTNSNTDFVPHIYQIMNYTNTSTYKTVLFRTSGQNEVIAQVGLWRSTSAIDSITLTLNTAVNNFATGSTFTLYGIKAA